MIRRLFRLALLAGAAAAVTAWLRSRQRSDDPLPTPAGSPSGPWPPVRNESPAAPAETPTAPAPSPAPARTTEPTVVPEPDGVPVADADRPWTEPAADGGCPPGYPIKAKMGSKIFHAPGQLNYDRTTPDRCYADAAAAEADGLRAAKR